MTAPVASGWSGCGCRYGTPRGRLLRRHPLSFVVVLPLFVLAAGGYLYWDYAEHFETTDDAFIAARQAMCLPPYARALCARV
jgi:hypothetical protein